MAVLITFAIILLLILINGLFVAAEFSIIGVRPSRVEQLVEEGNRRARWVQATLTDRHKTDRYIATSQLGVTLASLGLGMYAEPSIAALVEPILHGWFHLDGVIVHTISFVLALSLVTYLHVVIGEMIPKSLALHLAEHSVLFLAGPMAFMERVFALPVAGLNLIGTFLMRLLRVPPPSESRQVYSPEELEFIVAESYAGGLVEEHEQEFVGNILDFSERRVVQIMTPRKMMEAIPLTTSEEELLELAMTEKHSRIPVYDGAIDNVIGALHLKDFVRQQISDEPYDLRPLLRQVPFVPETLHVETLLDTFRKLHQHMALVIDEFGGIVGLVTLEDLIEEVVGEVRDEFDEGEEEPIITAAPGHLVVQGTVLLEDVSEIVPLDDHGHDVHTVGGLVLAELSRPPQVGDEVSVAGVTLHVEAVEDLAVTRVAIHFEPSADTPPGEEA